MSRQLVSAKEKAEQFKEIMLKNDEAFRQALPRHLDSGRFIRIALTAFNTTPKLLECTLASVFGAILEAAQLGLEIGTLGHAWLVPYGNTAQLMIGYQGLIDLAWRSGQIKSIMAREVYEADVFEPDFSMRYFRHVPSEKPDRGKLRAVYAVVETKSGGIIKDFMWWHEVEAIKARSKSRNNGPWTTDPAMMGRKTILRRVMKTVPKSAQMARAITVDEEAEVGVQDLSPGAMALSLPAPVEDDAPSGIADGGLSEAIETGELDLNR